jgi:hypothetical protein
MSSTRVPPSTICSELHVQSTMSSLDTQPPIAQGGKRNKRSFKIPVEPGMRERSRRKTMDVVPPTRSLTMAETLRRREELHGPRSKHMVELHHVLFFFTVHYVDEWNIEMKEPLPDALRRKRKTDLVQQAPSAPSNVSSTTAPASLAPKPSLPASPQGMTRAVTDPVPQSVTPDPPVDASRHSLPGNSQGTSWESPSRAGN